MTEQERTRSDRRSRAVVGPDYLMAGRYRLRSKLGGGGMGAVWLAHDTLLDREVAVKQVTSTTGMDDAEAREVRNRALREGRNAAQLSHDHAIAMYDVAVESGEPWLVMEYLPSRSLAEAMNLVDTLPPLEVAQIGAQIAAALTDAHAAGILHRDIKPGNILVADRGDALGIVKISDFGIARAKGDAPSGKAGVITGTPAYFAPEVARGDDPTEASDVFSLGATLYTVVEGQPPFGLDSDPIALLHRVAKAEIYRPSLSGPLTDTLLHMLEPDPTRRPTMAQARDALAAVALRSDDAGPGHTVLLMGEPVKTSDGNVPNWAYRSAPAAIPRRRLGSTTATDLPAVQPNTPLGSVPRPAGRAWLRQLTEGLTGPQAPTDVRGRIVAAAPLAMAVMVGVIVLAFVVVLIVALAL
ncbi:serine/threonine-protein kinase [Prescottella agglutinans]|uniref:non-specific serine/threonine protein kinase n=1 Tax=Prescottella agglutinans TaxID=1644129 RepID=A0ABT6M4L9_9NOCA|nr:serine/threonine protein kinase [Prescottella agglutinans]